MYNIPKSYLLLINGAIIRIITVETRFGMIHSKFIPPFLNEGLLRAKPRPAVPHRREHHHRQPQQLGRVRSGRRPRALGVPFDVLPHGGSGQRVGVGQIG